ncbi:pimeloyl-ACP methyl esterase BioG family protein, partial [Duncaniella muris]
MKFHVFPPTDPNAPERAILIFAGWGMDEKPFASLKQEGYRIIAVWDYREPAFPPSLVEELEQYREIAVIGWSFGVPAATRFLAAHSELPVSARIAVNGTMHPVSDSLGIPEAIFRGTLAGLSEKTLSKFNLRMCGSAESYRRFSLTLPARDIDGLRAELEAVESAGDACGAIWDTAIVGTADRIIPPENQLRAWQGGEAVETLTVADGPHLPDFQAIINEFITEKGLVAEKFGRAGETYDDNAVVQRQIAEKLCSQAIAAGAADCRSILEIGCGTGLTTRMLAEA